VNHVFLLAPGSLDTLTGGYEYDRRMVAGLRDRGWTVSVRELDDSFPRPTAAALAHAARTLGEIPDGMTVLIDGLALGAMPAEAGREARRLRLVAVVHHPLAEETGLDPAVAAELAASERQSLAVVRLVIVTSEATAVMLKKYGVDRDRIACVEPGTDRAPLATGSAGRFVQLLCVATLVPRKGHTILAAALASIRNLEWRLTCVGSLTRDPQTVDRVRAIVRAGGIEDRVRFAGEVEGAPLAAYYASGDVFVLPTFYEGYGMAVANALARGMPVISTPTGAIPRLVGAETARPAGILVPPGDHHALALALKRVIEDRAVREHYARGARSVRDALMTWDDAAAGLAEAITPHDEDDE
jgi:glycosyltransferase involved in cell wall biosynthesis